jgi:glycosyltransferase involved in cell wall biosynthesis
MGKALVSTTIGCEGLAVRPNEHLLVADAPAEFADSVVCLLKDPGRREALGRSARSLVEQRYSWLTIGGELLNAYRLAIEHRKHRR